jgi:gamma-glutamyltranspeptidase/glutathione hydrolase
VLEVLEGLPPLRGTTEPDRVLTLVRALGGTAGPSGHTTNLVTVDADGDACVLTTSLGLGSGDFLPGFDLHLNSMLGERDLVRGALEPGRRMESMMTPALASDDAGPVVAVGAAGGTRLRSALVQVVAGVLDEALGPQAAVARPRLHPAGRTVHLEPGFEPATLTRLEAQGFEPRSWAARHHYFGGVSLVTRSGAAGDPRRDGAAHAL